MRFFGAVLAPAGQDRAGHADTDVDQDVIAHNLFSVCFPPGEETSAGLRGRGPGRGRGGGGPSSFSLIFLAPHGTMQIRQL